MRRTRDERGAVAVFAATMLTMVMVAAALTVDIGMQRVLRTDLQSAADLVALDLARELDGRTVADLRAPLTQMASASLARNTSIVGDDPVEIEVRFGEMNDSGQFVEMLAGVPSAVRVELSSTVERTFAAVISDEPGSASRRADADASSTVCFRMGSFAAALDTEDSELLDTIDDLLDGMLGVNLDLVSYRGLAAAEVSLAQIASVATVGSPEALLGADIGFRTLLAATADALRRENDATNTVAISALDRILSADLSATLGAIALGDVLHVRPDDVAAMQVDLNVLDIIGTARLADGEYFLGIPNIQAQVPGVGFQFEGGITLVAAAQLACGDPDGPPATADTAQLGGALDIEFTNLPSLNVGGIGTLQTPKGTAELSVSVAEGTGTLRADPRPTCGSGTLADPSTFSVDVETGLASYQLVSRLSVGGEVRVTNLLGLGLLNVLTNLLGALLPNRVSIEVELTLTARLSISGSDDQVDLAIPPNDQTPVRTGQGISLDPGGVVPAITSVKIGSSAVSLGSVTALTTPIIDKLLEPTHGFVDKSLAQLIENINDSYIGPVAEAAGIRLAGADTYGVAVMCGMPRLVG